MTREEQDRSNTMYVASTLAILSVICAHMKLSLQPETEGYYVDKIQNLFGIIGVACFFIKSGYYYKRKEGDTVSFWKRKALNLIVPWFFWSILTYILNCILLRTEYSFINQIKWTFGYGTWYYFAFALICLFIVCKLCYGKLLGIALLVLLSVISNVLSITGVLAGNSFYTGYTNFFNWAIFFAVGMIWRMYQKSSVEGSEEHQINKLLMLLTLLCTVVLLSILIFVVHGNKSVSYWQWWSLVFEFAGFIVVYSAAYVLKNSSLLRFIGKNTLFIYLTHMQICGAINTRLPKNAFIYGIKPFVGLFVMTLICIATIRLFKCLKLDKFLFLFGIHAGKEIK